MPFWDIFDTTNRGYCLRNIKTLTPTLHILDNTKTKECYRRVPNWYSNPKFVIDILQGGVCASSSNYRSCAFYCQAGPMFHNQF